MSRTLASIQAIQSKINESIDRLKGEINTIEFQGDDLNYILNQQRKLALFYKPLSGQDWFPDYSDRFDKLKKQLDALLDPNQTNFSAAAKKHILKLALLAAQALLNVSLDYLKTHVEEEQEECLSEVIQLQKKVDDGLGVFNTKREKIFHLNLSGLREHYEKAYKDNYGKSYFNYFFFLPCKRFFRQKSREEEIGFIETIEKYLVINDAKLSPDSKWIIKLSALNLVRFKIRTELFGDNSHLGRLINLRIKEAGFTNNNEIMHDFPAFCSEKKIAIPQILVDCYNDCLSKSTKTVAVS